MAGSSSYPELVDNKTQLQDGVDYMEADNINNAYVPINSTQTFIGANGKGASWSTDILEYLANTKAPIVTKASNSTLSVSAGTVFIKNSGQSNRLMRRNTNAVTVTASNLDTGSMANNTFYYLFAVADTAATTFTVKFSTSSSSPTGLTNFELIGWFYNQSGGALDVTLDFTGNVKRNNRDVPNIASIAGTTDISSSSTSFVLMTGMSLRFYSSGRPVKMRFSGPVTAGDADVQVQITFIVDTVQKGRTEVHTQNLSADRPVPAILEEKLDLAAGEHLIEVHWKTTSNSAKQNGSTDGQRILVVEEA